MIEREDEPEELVLQEKKKSSMDDFDEQFQKMFREELEREDED